MSSEQNTVLICDDRADMRARIRSELEKLPQSKVLQVEHPSQVEQVLKSEPHIRLLMLDLRFPSEPGGEDMRLLGHEILPHIRSNFPHLKVIVVTTVGAGEAMDILVEALRRHLADDWMNVGSIFPEGEIYARAYNQLFPMGEVSEGGLWLTHLSDLHFGDSERFRFWGLAEDGALLDAIVRDQKSVFPKEAPAYPERNDMIVVSGDCTHRGRDPEFTKAAQFLCQFYDSTSSKGKAASSQERPLVVVPGNHDLNWDISRARALYGKVIKYHELHSEQEVPEELRYLRPYVWAPFEHFLQALRLRSPTVRTHWNITKEFASAEWLFPEYGLFMVGFNSCAGGVSHCQNIPRITPETLRDLDQAKENENEIKAALPGVAVCHHSIGAGPAADERMNEDGIRELRTAFVRRLGVAVVMTGHVHKEVVEVLGDQDLLAIGAGTSGGSRAQGRTNLQYNIIRIIPRGTAGCEETCVEIYPRICLDGEFAQDPRRARILCRWMDNRRWVIA